MFFFCFLVFCFSAQESITVGLGLFLGGGLSFPVGRTDGPMKTGTGRYRYGEVEGGWGPSAGVSVQGKENLNDGPPVRGWGPFNRMIDPDRIRRDSVQSVSISGPMSLGWRICRSWYCSNGSVGLFAET